MFSGFSRSLFNSAATAVGGDRMRSRAVFLAVAVIVPTFTSPAPAADIANSTPNALQKSSHRDLGLTLLALHLGRQTVGPRVWQIAASWSCPSEKPVCCAFLDPGFAECVDGPGTCDARSGSTLGPDDELPSFSFRNNCTSAAAAARWSCSATCNVQQIDKDADCPDRVSGSASGSSEDDACREAKRAATQSTPQGCYPRHCSCDCSKD